MLDGGNSHTGALMSLVRCRRARAEEAVGPEVCASVESVRETALKEERSFLGGNERVFGEPC